jgi:putative acetyltransferase
MNLFYNTVHVINARDYSTEQLNAWAPPNLNDAQWNYSLQEHYTIVAVENNEIIGFGDIDSSGYLDKLFVHIDHQGRGIATAICDKLEKYIKGTVTTHASITARPFFESRGYRIVRRQNVERRGVKMENFVMEKSQEGDQLLVQIMDGGILSKSNT